MKPQLFGKCVQFVSLRGLIERGLEEHAARRPSARASRPIATALATMRRERPLHWPDGVLVITIGGVTLGGSGKTPLAVACAGEVSRYRNDVVLVGHSYRASPGYARFVEPHDTVNCVGDEALASARHFSTIQPKGPRVVVAPTRQEAVDFAFLNANVVVIDGMVQARPQRAHLAVLALDAASRVPSSHSRHYDAAVTVIDRLDANVDADLPGGISAAVVQSRGVGFRSQLGLVPWDQLGSRRFGFASAMARPQRVLDFLTRRGVVPRCTARLGDHQRPTSPTVRWMHEKSRELNLEGWLVSSKCSESFGSLDVGAPLVTIDYAVILPEGLRRQIASLDRAR